MTGGAAHTFVHVNAVVEIGIVRKIVDPDPLEWIASAKTGAHWFQIRTISPDLLVAVHTRLGRGHACGGSNLHRIMAIATVDTIVTDVMFVAKLNRLLSLNPLARVPGRAVYFRSHPEGRDENEDCAINA